tara:strand:- start:1849 stop:3063 length:1215 start_codon:yes stop_codon:yes gene_type:complete
MIKQNKNIDINLSNLEKIYREDPNNIPNIINLANIYIASGNFIQALKFTKLASKSSPKNLGIDFTLSNLIDYNKDDNHQKMMLEKSEDNSIKEEDKIPLYFALGKSFNDQKKYSKSFHFYSLGNKIKNSTLNNYSLEIEEIYEKKIKEIFSNINFSQINIKKLFNKKLIFIVGLPRSGTSLVHQILASHSKIKGLGESEILNGFFNNKILDSKFLNRLTKNNLINYEFISEVSNYIGLNYEKNSNNKIILDKSPFNFFWLGFIKLIFPNAKILHIVRDQEDTCLSIYKSLFGKRGVLWSYDKKNIIKFVKIYNNIIKFWSEKIPNYIYDLKYEQLIQNQKKETKKILSFCDLEWEDGCLEFYKNTLPIKSASLYQTRKPIYKSSIKQNLKYSNFINFVKEIKNR